MFNFLGKTNKEERKEKNSGRSFIYLPQYNSLYSFYNMRYMKIHADIYLTGESYTLHRSLHSAFNIGTLYYKCAFFSELD